MVLIAILTAFLECILTGTRPFFGAQIDLVPALMVYSGLTASVVSVCALAFFAGLSLDTLSWNPLGTSVLPLLAIGLLVFWCRHLILRDQLYAQLLLGLVACAAVPVMCLLTLLGLGEHPLVGWGSLWQWLVMMIGGALLTPVVFFIMDRVQHALSYSLAGGSGFRPDREIKRGR
jgi:cell shape-determining protein MreD